MVVPFPSMPYKATFSLSVLALTLAHGLFGQIQTGRISGTIYDPNKAVVPNATLTVKNRETNVAQRFTSNDSGSYVVPSLNPGMYDVSATAAGFRANRRRAAADCNPQQGTGMPQSEVEDKSNTKRRAP